jgi:hypothetical protein
MGIFIYLVIYFYLLTIVICMVFHIGNRTPFPTTVKNLFKLTFLPYVIYKIIRKEKF